MNKSFIFWLKYHWSIYTGVQLIKSSITWTNVNPIHWLIYAVLGVDVLRVWCDVYHCWCGWSANTMLSDIAFVYVCALVVFHEALCPMLLNQCLVKQWWKPNSVKIQRLLWNNEINCFIPRYHALDHIRAYHSSIQGTASDIMYSISMD